MNKPSLFNLFIGNLMISFAYAKWMVPNQIINGGATSLAMILSKVTDGIVSDWTMILSISFLLLALLFLGNDCFFKSIVGSSFYMLFFRLFYQYLPIDFSVNLVIDFILAAFFIAAGYNLCLKANASTVGLDVLALILHKKISRFDVSTYLFFLNFLVLVLGFLIYGLQDTIKGFLFSFCYTKLLGFFQKRAQRKVFDYLS